MSDVKWIGWDKPVSLQSREARVLPHSKAVPWKAGCFRFDDGTTQGWTLNQLYDTDTGKKVAPGVHPTTGLPLGFVVQNSQNLALAAAADPLVVPDPSVTECDIYLESPDLSTRAEWQGIKGFSLDLYRTLTSQGGESSTPSFFAQLQLSLIDMSDNSKHLFAEWDAKKKNFLFHVVTVGTAYNLVWNTNDFSDPKYKILQVRIRLSMPNNPTHGGGELALRGRWLIGNVCPEK